MTEFFISAKHKVIGVPATPAIKNLFPEAKELQYNGHTLSVIPHDAAGVHLLKQMGYKVGAPILTHYEWTGVHKPFIVQKLTCALLTMNTRAYVLNDLGTGKTASALWAFDYLKKMGHVNKALIIAPLSTLNFVWGREILAITPHLKYQILHHSNRHKRLERLNDMEADIYIINHDGASLLHDNLLARKDIDLIIIDELSVYRNHGTTRSKKLRELAKSRLGVWGMTGKPIPRAPTDVFGQAKIITPDRVPQYFRSIQQDMMIKVSQFQWVPKDGAIERAFNILQPSVRFELSDVTELPPCVERMQQVDLGPKQKKIYETMVKKCYIMMGNDEIKAVHASALMTKLVQISCGWVYNSQGTAVELDHGTRTTALIDIINDGQNKIIVYVPFKHALSGISKLLASNDIDHCVASGDTPPNQRAQLFNLFQNTTKYKVMVAHPRCIAHGLTLTAADTTIWFCPTHDLDIYDQANGRIRRVGQKNKQQIIKLFSTPVERKIYRSLDEKTTMQVSLLDLLKQATSDSIGNLT